MITKENIINECKKVLNKSQFLVDVKEKKINIFTVYVDDYNGISIKECQRINKEISKAFDKDIVDYSLEISSPGLDKPFKVYQQYVKNINKQIEVLLKCGNKNIGTLKEVSEKFIKIEEKIKKGKNLIKIEKIIDFSDIKSVKNQIKI